MSSVKESLQHMIEQMSDEEARQMLEFAHHLQQKRDQHDHEPQLARFGRALDAAFRRK